jgi:omega-amidase
MQSDKLLDTLPNNLLRPVPDGALIRHTTTRRRRSLKALPPETKHKRGRAASRMLLATRRVAATCLLTSKTTTTTPASSRLRASSLPPALLPPRAAARPRAAAASTSTRTSSRAMDTPPPVQPERVRVALCQLEVGADKAQNIARAREAIRAAAATLSSLPSASAAAAQGAPIGGANNNPPRVIILPEMWNCPYSNDSFGPYSEAVPPTGTRADDIPDDASPSIAMMAREARDLGVVLVGGSVPEREEEGGEGTAASASTSPSSPTTRRLYNTCCVFERDGSLVAKHRKLHLFDIDIPGKMTFRESDTLAAGEKATLVDTSAGRLGLGICYDLRFPELALLYARSGASLLVYPGAFNTVTGPLHWELLARARAVDAQCYVCVCSPSRVPGASYQAHGHSMAVGPFAEVVARAEAPGDAPGLVTAELEYGQVVERRRNLPLWAQRRGDLYELVDKKSSSSRKGG